MTAGRDRHIAILAVSLYSVLFLAIALVESRAKPLWHDEIFTWALATQPSVQAIWQAQRDGLDLGPPLNSLVTHAVVGLAGSDPLALRLPAMAGFWTMSVTVFAMVRRRSNAVVATAALLLPFFTAALPYSYEARSYGLMLAFTAACLYFWSEAAAGRRRALALPLLSATLAASLWNHYFGVLACVPLALGELTRTIRSRRVDWPVIGSFAAAVVLTLPLVVLLRMAVGEAGGYWQAAAWSDIEAACEFVAGFLVGRRFLLLYALVAVLAALTWRPGSTAGPGAALPPHEIAAGLAALLIPLLGVALGVLVTGVFVDRYAMSGVVGLAVVLPLAVWFGGRRRLLPAGVFAVGLAAAVLVSADKRLRTERAGFVSPVTSRRVLLSLLEGPKPVVVTGITYLQAWYYASEVQRQRLRYPADPAAAFRLIGTNTVERGYLEMVRRVPIGVEPLEPFVRREPSFVVYAKPPDEWLTTTLREAGLTLVEIAREDDAIVYDVRR